MGERRGSGRLQLDGNGVPYERKRIGGQEVIVHYDDVPEKDLTTVDGIRCTTALRTLIDLGAELDADALHPMVDDCLRRALFTVEEALGRTAEPDIRDRRGTRLVRQLVKEHAAST